MIPAKKKRQHRDKLQQQRHRNGTAWEEQLCEELNTLPHAWARCWPKSWHGQPFDISAQMEGRALAIECKSIARGICPFPPCAPTRSKTSAGSRTPAAPLCWRYGGTNRPPGRLSPGGRFGHASWPGTGAAFRWAVNRRPWPKSGR